MKLTITARKVTMRPSFEENTQAKLDKLDKFFEKDADCTVTVTQLPRNTLKVEATVHHSGMIYRAETINQDANDAVDILIDLLIRQIRKNKTRLEKRLRTGAFDMEPATDWENEEEEFHIVRQKRFAVRPLDVEEAILQMNLLGHQFFTFLNAETGTINVVYRRHDDSYGLLDPYME